MAWSDVRARYKRSVLGPLWITLSTAIGVVGLGFVWSALFHLERKTYIPMLTVGLILWQFISGTIVESSSVFTRQAGLIKNLDLPISLHPAQLVLRQFINFAHNIPLYFIVVLLLGSPLNASCLLAIPALMLVILNLYWIVLLIGIFGARYRDLEYLIATTMPLLMFFSPVMYSPDNLPPTTGRFIWFNPLAHMIELVRYPLLGHDIPLFLLASNLSMLVVGGSITLFVFNKKRNRVALWV
jgi:ABC-type polysaccharide/polyol phosphate export permease